MTHWSHLWSAFCSQLRQRRLQRPPDPVQLSPSAVAAAEASGLSEPWHTGADGDDDACALDAAELPLPKDIVHTLLQERYREVGAELHKVANKSVTCNCLITPWWLWADCLVCMTTLRTAGHCHV